MALMVATNDEMITREERINGERIKRADSITD
jgi:hypothetical protein